MAERPYWRGGGERYHEPPEHDVVTGPPAITPSAPLRRQLPVTCDSWPGDSQFYSITCVLMPLLRGIQGFHAIEVSK